MNYFTRKELGELKKRLLLGDTLPDLMQNNLEKTVFVLYTRPLSQMVKTEQSFYAAYFHSLEAQDVQKSFLRRRAIGSILSIQQESIENIESYSFDRMIRGKIYAYLPTYLYRTHFSSL